MSETAKEIRKHSRRMWVAIGILLVLIFANFSIAIAHPNDTTQTIIGPVGPVGPTGHEGPQGPAGKDGKDGVPGPQGIQGIQGTQGIQGLMGPIGESGANGLNGADGKNGLNGLDGQNGRNVELRGNDTDKTIEWRLEGDPDWHILTYYCQLTNTCIPTTTTD